MRPFGLFVLALAVSTAGCIQLPWPDADAQTPTEDPPAETHQEDDEGPPTGSEESDTTEDAEGDPSPEAVPPTMTVLEARLVPGCGYEDSTFDCHHVLVEVDARQATQEADPREWEAVADGQVHEGIKQSGPGQVEPGSTGTMEVRFVVGAGSVDRLTAIAFQDSGSGERIEADIPPY